MSEQELNSYRLTGTEEPTDEMLSQIMREIAEEVRVKNAAIKELFMAKLGVEAGKRKSISKCDDGK